MSEIHSEINHAAFTVITESDIKHKAEALALYVTLVTKRDYTSNMTSNVSYGYIHKIFG